MELIILAISVIVGLALLPALFMVVGAFILAGLNKFFAGIAWFIGLGCPRS